MSYRKFFQKNNFLGGEASPLLHGRSDLVQYQLGCEKMRNFIVLKGGGATRRPGTRYFARTGVSGQSGFNSAARIFEFTIGNSESYIVEVSSDGVTTSWKIVANSSTPATADTLNVTDLSGNPGFFTVAELFEFQIATIGANTYIVHPNSKPIVLSRITSSNFDLNFMDGATGTLIGASDRGTRVPYLPVANGTSTTITPSAVSGTGITLTASANIFVSGHVGSWFYVNGGYVLITGFGGVTTLTGDVIGSNLTGTGADSAWRESSWSDYRGWPRAIGVYNQRLVMGGTEFYPDTLWFSQVADYAQMWANASTGVSDPKEIPLASDQFNSIQWISGGKKLAIGTSRSEWIGKLEVTSAGELDQEFKQETNHGSAYVQAARVGYTVNFAQRGQKNVRELAFNFDSDSYVATDVNIFSSHIASEFDGDEIKQFAWQESPFQCLWVTTGNGKLYGFTRDRQQQVAAWHSHVIGGTAPYGYFDVVVDSVAVVSAPDGTYDRVYMVVQRSINGSTTRSLEWMDRFRENQETIDPGTSITNALNYLDSLKVFTSGGSTSSITGQTHLSSDTAYVIAVNTADYGTDTIVYSGELSVDGSGNITLPNSLKCNIAFVGLHASARINTLPQDGTEGPPVYPGSIRRTDKIYIRLNDTFGLKIGTARSQKDYGVEETPESDFYQLPFWTDQTSGIQSTFTGIKTTEPPSEYDQENGIGLLMTEPWPCTILSVNSRIVVNEV